MANRAHELYGSLVKAGQVNPMDELKRRGIAQCVLDHIRHNEQRGHGLGGTSDIEMIGHDWRKAHGFGKPFWSGGRGGRGPGYKDRELAKQRRLKRKQALRGKLVGIARKVAALPKRLVRKAARGS